jgi:hypothetical protein
MLRGWSIWTELRLGPVERNKSGWDGGYQEEKKMVLHIIYTPMQ